MIQIFGIISTQKTPIWGKLSKTKSNVLTHLQSSNYGAQVAMKAAEPYFIWQLNLSNSTSIVSELDNNIVP